MAMQTSVLPSNMVAMRYRLMNIYHVTNEAGQAENFEIFKENKRLIGASHLDQKKFPVNRPSIKTSSLIPKTCSVVAGEKKQEAKVICIPTHYFVASVSDD